MKHPLVVQFEQHLDADYSDLYQIGLHIGLQHPQLVKDVLLTYLTARPAGSTLFNDLFSYLPIEDFPELIDYALSTLRVDSGHDAAQDIIAQASLQALPALHPHLTALFELAPNRTSYYRSYPWRDSGLQHLHFLSHILADDSLPTSKRRRACENLLETREPAAFDMARDHWHIAGVTFQEYLLHVGYEIQDASYRPLYTERPLHIVFPRDFLEIEDLPFHREPHHPTWNLVPLNETTYRFGGQYEGHCSACNGNLHHVLTLESLPVQLEIKSVTSLVIVTCLSCQMWNRLVYVEHDAEGQPKSVNPIGQITEHELPANPLPELAVKLADGGRRWRWQEWGHAYGRENLTRLGGHPSWIQNADYPVCAGCGGRMHFIFQLDDRDWGWAAYGIGYIFWCDHCRISAHLCQYT